MKKFRLTLDAGIVPVTDTTEDFYNVSRLREQWLVSHVRSTFDFETKESLAAFLQAFGKLLGTE